MDMHAERIERLRTSAERYDSYAETAELMGDAAGADRFRDLASHRRLEAMRLLDD